ncbi:hypothetical protein PT974_11368 [Cladobotryum mycophilum]|uniref:HAT C-terminal dimerisation domain-containing protein n=1 Tax=Cladobotryum mycophilum TaxID=491253 RepID=A0ABR0S5I4_9HYPO
MVARTPKEYGIARQIGYHTGDNATSNDTCLKHLSQILQDKYGISFHPDRQQIRRIAHIINLSLRAFLLASSKEALRAALAAASDATDAEMYENFYFTLYNMSSNEPASRSEASATLWAEGKNSTLSQVLTIMNGLLRHYEKNKEHYSRPETLDRRILYSIEMGWFMLDKYYTMADDAPVYAAALLLDPSKRMRYIERHWPEPWYENAISGARAIWEEEYKSHLETGSVGTADEVSTSPKRQPNEWDSLLEEIEVTGDLGDTVDDFEDFIKALPIKISRSPLEWWCHRDQRKNYPQLGRMAINILSIAPESAFSGGRRTLSWDRERMTCKNLERVECIGSWLREGHIQKTVDSGMSVITDTGLDSGGDSDLDFNYD